MRASQHVVPPVPDVVKQGAQGAVETAVPAALLNPLAITKQAAFENVNGCVVYSIVRLLSKFAKQVNNKTLYFVATEERHQNWTDKGDHG
tara:strand:- start:153 stop:422 length:270 start_codon:yes stop_codon:yes gene_type:complete